MIDYPEIALLRNTSSSEVIIRCKGIFACHGIPEHVISDNGPQFASAEFSKFAKKYGFNHQTSSPRYPQANGMAEKGVGIVKNLIMKSQDPYLALLSYRSSPLSCAYSPAELLMGRKIRNRLPNASIHLQQSKTPPSEHQFSSETQRKGVETSEGW